MRAHLNIYSRQVVQRYTKHNNNSTSLTYNVIHIMQDISVTGNLSPRQLILSMAPSYTVVLEKNNRHQESVTMRK